MKDKKLREALVEAGVLYSASLNPRLVQEAIMHPEHGFNQYKFEKHEQLCKDFSRLLDYLKLERYNEEGYRKVKK